MARAFRLLASNPRPRGFVLSCRPLSEKKEKSVTYSGEVQLVAGTEKNTSAYRTSNVTASKNR